MKECNFEELPEKLRNKINILKLKIINCADSEHGSQCIVQDWPIFGIYYYNKVTNEIKYQWIGEHTIKILHRAIESTRP